MVHVLRRRIAAGLRRRRGTALERRSRAFRLSTPVLGHQDSRSSASSEQRVRYTCWQHGKCCGYAKTCNHGNRDCAWASRMTSRDFHRDHDRTSSTFLTCSTNLDFTIRQPVTARKPNVTSSHLKAQQFFVTRSECRTHGVCAKIADKRRVRRRV